MHVPVLGCIRVLGTSCAMHPTLSHMLPCPAWPIHTCPALLDLNMACAALACQPCCVVACRAGDFAGADGRRFPAA
eukprot:5508566-Lingulodinium_polyedra.AAC.1